MQILEFQHNDANQPPMWDNRQSIPFFRHAKDRPVIDDFEVALVKWIWPDHESELDEYPYSIYFYSKKRGFISGPEWDMRELRDDKFEIPLNIVEEDMYVWVITTHKEFVYFLDGNYKKSEYFSTPWSNIPLGRFLKKFQLPVFDAWSCYKIPKERYISEWKLAIEACKNFG